MNESLHSILLHLHSVGRWIMLILLIIGIFNSLVAGERPYIKSDARTGLILTIVTDLMLVIGVVLWYFGPIGFQLVQSSGGFGAAMKDPVLRFYGVEHLTGMLIAVILIHIGKAQGKKNITDKKKHMRTMWFYLIALVIILATVPWPFRAVGAGRGWY